MIIRRTVLFMLPGVPILPGLTAAETAKGRIQYISNAQGNL